MTWRSGLRTAGLGLCTALLIAACGGDSSEKIRVEGLVYEAGDGGTFTATGSPICVEGEYANLDFDFTDTLWTFQDEYWCADGTGTFVLSAELPLDPNAEGSQRVSKGRGRSPAGPATTPASRDLGRW